VHIVFKEMKIGFVFYLRVMFYLVGIFRTSSLGDSISSNPSQVILRELLLKISFLCKILRKVCKVSLERWVGAIF